MDLKLRLLEILDHPDFYHLQFDSGMISKLKDNLYLKGEFKGGSNPMEIGEDLLEKLDKEVSDTYSRCECGDDAYNDCYDDCIEVVKKYFGIK